MKKTGKYLTALDLLPARERHLLNRLLARTPVEHPFVTDAEGDIITDEQGRAMIRPEEQQRMHENIVKRFGEGYENKFIWEEQSTVKTMDNSKETFEQELQHLINRHSMENGSNTPDFLLAEHLKGSLDVFNKSTADRDKWYGHHSKDTVIPPDPTYSEADLISFGTYLLSEERASSVDEIARRHVGHWDLENFKEKTNQT